MNKASKHSDLDPRGPEGVPVDAPGNDGPAISPHAVSRMHRAEDDAQAFANSPEYTDTPGVATDDRKENGRLASSPVKATHDDVSRRLNETESDGREPNPGHHTHKDDTDPPRGLGDGELMEQPASTKEARQKGPR